MKLKRMKQGSKEINRQSRDHFHVFRISDQVSPWVNFWFFVHLAMHTREHST